MNKVKNIRILYVDDEACMRENVVEYLGYYCDHVYQAKDGVEGLQMYEKVKPDIIISDISMPRKNGLDMIKEIRTHDSETKIIVATAHIETEYLLLAVELGLIKYLVKPITEDKLLPILQACMQKISGESMLFRFDDTHTFDRLNSTLLCGNEVVDLAKKELDFLELLIDNAHRVVKYEELNSVVWNGEMSEDAMRTIVKELRRKISKESLKNISKSGYQIQKQASL